MTDSLIQILLALLAGLALIIVLTSRLVLHPFFALLLGCFVVGIGVKMSFDEILEASKNGFGQIMRSLGFIIVLGTSLGALLEHSGRTQVMAAAISRFIGGKRPSFAMSLTGFIVGLPLFCDSGYIVLHGINNSVAKRFRIPVVVPGVSLATGLYSVHCLLPPHPGATAAAVSLNVDLGRLILVGLLLAMPAMIVGWLWAQYAGRKFSHKLDGPEASPPGQPQGSVLAAFAPVVIPILLIAVKSVTTLVSGVDPLIKKIFFILGDPVIALSVGILLALIPVTLWRKESLNSLLAVSAEKAGGILVITGAGGAFGGVIAATDLGQQFSQSSWLSSLGLALPFLIAFLLKTAQGSSTVAIITTASIIAPLLPALGLDSDHGNLLAVLSMGAGSMMISHANDSYFWVVSKFSNIPTKAMLKVYSLATLFMGIISFIMVYILAFFLG